MCRGVPLIYIVFERITNKARGDYLSVNQLNAEIHPGKITGMEMDNSLIDSEMATTPYPADVVKRFGDLRSCRLPKVPSSNLNLNLNYEKLQSMLLQHVCQRLLYATCRSEVLRI